MKIKKVIPFFAFSVLALTSCADVGGGSKETTDESLVSAVEALRTLGFESVLEVSTSRKYHNPLLSLNDGVTKYKVENCLV